MLRVEDASHASPNQPERIAIQPAERADEPLLRLINPQLLALGQTEADVVRVRHGKKLLKQSLRRRRRFPQLVCQKCVPLLAAQLLNNPPLGHGRRRESHPIDCLEIHSLTRRGLQPPPNLCIGHVPVPQEQDELANAASLVKPRHRDKPTLRTDRPNDSALTEVGVQRSTDEPFCEPVFAVDPQLGIGAS